MSMPADRKGAATRRSLLPRLLASFGNFPRMPGVFRYECHQIFQQLRGGALPTASISFVFQADRVKAAACLSLVGLGLGGSEAGGLRGAVGVLRNS
jgi:hypothetical protein